MESTPQTIFKTNDAANTSDGFANFSARLGVTPRFGGCEDNLLSKGHYEFNLITRNRIQLEAGYRGSWLIGAIVNSISQDMTRAGIQITTNEGAEDVQEIQNQMSRLQIWTSICETMDWGRLYGGAIAVLQIKGQNLATQLDTDSIKQGQFQGLAVYDRWQLNPSMDKVIQSGPDMGLPEFYDIVNNPGQEVGGTTTNNATGQTRVHHSRCIRMIGIKLPYFQAITEMMWGESVLERIWDRLIMFDTATASAGSLINRAYLRTVGIEGLREILGAGGQAQENLIAQFEYMRQLQQNEGITLLDKNDTFATNAYSFAGLSDMLIQFGQQISGGCNPPIPLVRLFGQSPAGLSATGESDIRLYYDGVNAQQEAHLRNPMECLLKVLWLSHTGKPAPSDLSFTFTPLWQMSAIDKATIAKNNTDTIIEAHQEGLVDTATAMKELKLASGDNGIFTHITDEQIEEAENEEPPMPDEAPAQDPEAQPDSEPKIEGMPHEQDNVQPIKKAVGDSALNKFKKWFKNE